MAPSENDMPKRGVFISHITAEAPVAKVLQEYLRTAYPGDFPVFVSSDNVSIPGGAGWWQHIRDSIKKCQIILILLSDESVSREWINFEAGVGDGSRSVTIPVAIKNYRFDKLSFPLKGFQGRYVSDIEGILHDIDRATGRCSGSLDKAEYLDAIRKAEEAVTYKDLLFWPVRTKSQDGQRLEFRLENRGNTDVDLLFAEVRLPDRILSPHGPIPARPPTLEVDFDGTHKVFSYSTQAGGSFRPLLRTITRSMNVRRLYLTFLLKSDLTDSDLAARIRYHIFARDLDTLPDETALRDISFET